MHLVFKKWNQSLQLFSDRTMTSSAKITSKKLISIRNQLDIEDTYLETS